MGPVNWVAVAIAAILGAALHVAWFGVLTPGRKSTNRVCLLAVMLIAAAMLGHMYARIGVERLAGKPWLYWMQSGGLALAFIIPAVALGACRAGMAKRAIAVECGCWLVAYLAMGTVFWALK